MEIRAFLDFLKLAEKLKCQTRHSYTTSGRLESVAEHSWRLALMAYLLKDEFARADSEKVLAMCLIHDLGEAVTGDIPAFEKTKDDEAVESEAVALLLSKLPSPQREQMQLLFEEMERQQTLEARMYKALDKLEALIQHNEADLSTWLSLEYELQMTYGTKECEFSSYMKRLRDEVRADSVRKIETAEKTSAKENSEKEESEKKKSEKEKSEKNREKKQE